MARGAEASILTLRALRGGLATAQQVATYRGRRPSAAYQVLIACPHCRGEGVVSA